MRNTSNIQIFKTWGTWLRGQVGVRSTLFLGPWAIGIGVSVQVVEVRANGAYVAWKCCVGSVGSFDGCEQCCGSETSAVGSLMVSWSPELKGCCGWTNVQNVVGKARRPRRPVERVLRTTSENEWRGSEVQHDSIHNGRSEDLQMKLSCTERGELNYFSILQE